MLKKYPIQKLPLDTVLGTAAPKARRFPLVCRSLAAVLFLVLCSYAALRQFSFLYSALILYDIVVKKFVIRTIS